MQPQSPSRADARRLLRQYQHIKAYKADLERRRLRIISELSSTAGCRLQLQQIEDRMGAQEAAIVAAVLQILDIIDTLPPGSRERDIIERRYLDGLSWTAIARMVHISRSQAAEAEKHGIDLLLSDKRIAQAVREYAALH